jgi:integrase
VEAEWAEFDLDNAIWRIPPERMKKRKEHVIPLPTQAVEVLRAMHGITGRHQHVFPNRDDRTKPMAQASLRQALKKMGWAGKYSPHATRTTGSTRLNEMGFASDWIERQLAHEEPNAVRRTYNHAEHVESRRVMMQQWADYLMQSRAAIKSLLASSVRRQHNLPRQKRMMQTWADYLDALAAGAAVVEMFGGEVA